MAVLHRTKYNKRGGKSMSTSVMDVEENFVPVNSREDIEELMTNSSDKKTKKYFKKLFEFLGGRDSPIEAVGLALGRDTALKETQITVLSTFSSWIDELNCMTVAGDSKRKMLINFMSECNIVKLVVRLITLKASQPSGKEIFSKYLYYHCINILAHITNATYIKNGVERIRNMKIIRAYHAIPQLVEFLDPIYSDPLTVFQTSELLKHLASDKPDMCLRIYKADALRRCLHFMLRKEADKMYADYYQEHFSTKLSIPNEEGELVDRFYAGRKFILKKTERYAEVAGPDHRRDTLTYITAELQENCALVVFEIVSNPKVSKPEILSSKPFIKVLSKWFSTPPIWRTERTMIPGCFHILRGAISDEKPPVEADELLKNFDLLDLVRQHIYNADHEFLSGVLSLMSELAMQYPELRKKFLASRSQTAALNVKNMFTEYALFDHRTFLYAKLLPVYLQSYDQQVQTWTLQCMLSLCQSEAAGKQILLMGVTAENLYLLTEYNSPRTNTLLQNLKTEMERYCYAEWKISEELFRRVIVPKKYCLERAQKYKEEGNSRFKAEQYESAIKCYTLGLESVPPVETFSQEVPIHRGQNYRPWYVLPSVLLTNRAQCYLLLSKWEEAIDDCTAAIVKSYEDNEEAKKILFKTVFRRARAFSELKDYQNALSDISFCLRFNQFASNVRSLFREILTEYRKKFGIESLRRCGTCMEGVGMKLKRCARCPEMYCSRECQTYAWEDGHKQLCNYTLDDDNSE